MEKILFGFIAFLQSFISIFVLTTPREVFSIPTPTSSSQVLVDRVIDGDTFITEKGEKVRLIGINAPELHPKPECYANESKEYLISLIEHKEVMLTKDISDRDTYGRLLRYVYKNDLFINKDSISKGFSRVDIFKPDTSKQVELEKAEVQARQDNVGLWGSCSS